MKKAPQSFHLVGSNPGSNPKEAEYDSLERDMPKDGWLHEYMELTNDLEACPRFRFFSACCALGAVMSNKVWLSKGMVGRIYPNPWVLLVAPAGHGHKSKTIEMAGIMATQAQTRVLAQRTTPEALLDELAVPEDIGSNYAKGKRKKGEFMPQRIRFTDEATGLICVSELADYFGKVQYNQGLVALITNLYDPKEEYFHHTIGRGYRKLKNLCLSFIGGTTRNWMHMLPADAMTGGWLARHIIVEMPLKWNKKNANPKGRFEDLYTHGKKLEMFQATKFAGEMGYPKEAQDIFEDYYMSVNPEGNEQTDAYRSRTPEMIQKIAMLISLSKGLMYIEPQDMQTAKTMVVKNMEEIQPLIMRLQCQPRMMLHDELLEVVQRYGKIQEDKAFALLYQKCQYGRVQFYDAIIDMVTLGRITIDDGPTGKRTITLVPKKDAPGSSGSD